MVESSPLIDLVPRLLFFHLFSRKFAGFTRSFVCCLVFHLSRFGHCCLAGDRIHWKDKNYVEVLL